MTHPPDLPPPTPKKTNPVKIIALGCFGVFLLGVLAIAGIFLLVSAKKSKYDKIAIPFFAEAIPTLSTWDSAAFNKYWADEVHVATPPEQMARLFNTYKRLGELVRYEEPQFLGVYASTSNPYGSSVSYSIDAEYQHGAAKISCTLVPTKDAARLKIWSLHVSSNVFLDQPPPTPNSLP